MKTHWPAICFLVILGLAVGAQILTASEQSACEIGTLKVWSTEQNVPLFACWEFWLNRYQGLLGNLITAVVAFATLMWIKKQLDTSDRQTAVAASQALRARVQDLETEIARFDAALAHAANARIVAANLAGGPVKVAKRSVIEDGRSVLKTAKQIVFSIEKSFIDGLRPDSSVAIGAAIAFSHQAEMMQQALAEFAPKKESHKYAPIEYIENPEGSRVRQIFSECQSSVDRLVDILSLAKDATMKELEETWFRIREFENRAVRRSEWAQRDWR